MLCVGTRTPGRSASVVKGAERQAGYVPTQSVGTRLKAGGHYEEPSVWLR